MLLTVIVTVFNIGEYLPRFFESMAVQTFRNYCLLMVDDGSQDNSLKVCEAYAEKDARIKVISLDHVGIAKARNIAMDYIESEFTAYADGDDYVEPDYLRHLMDARKKYDADLAISRVMYQSEKDNIIDGYFPERGELLISREEFAEKLPMLLDDRRLNYLYGKVYRSSLLKDIRVEDAVKQGSDTMINCQYIAKINRIVLIDDLDYHYIKYNSRSVTSYSGQDAFLRICRINRYIRTAMESQGMLTIEMSHIIDKRILLSAIWVIDRIMSTIESQGERIAQIDAILDNKDYQGALQRYKDELWELGFDPICDNSGKQYIQRIAREKQVSLAKNKVLKVTPKWIHNIYRKICGK